MTSSTAQVSNIRHTGTPPCNHPPPFKPRPPPPRPPPPSLTTSPPSPSPPSPQTDNYLPAAQQSCPKACPPPQTSSRVSRIPYHRAPRRALSKYQRSCLQPPRSCLTDELAKCHREIFEEEILVRRILLNPRPELRVLNERHLLISDCIKGESVRKAVVHP